MNKKFDVCGMAIIVTWTIVAAIYLYGYISAKKAPDTSLQYKMVQTNQSALIKTVGKHYE